MKYNNRIKIDGDFSVASQWLGFAKNKANFLYDLSEKQGINYVKTYTPTGDVTIKVSIIQKIPHIYIRAIGGYLSGIVRYNERVLYDHDNNPNTDNIYGVKEFFPSPSSLKLGFKKEWKTTDKIYSEKQSYYYTLNVNGDNIIYEKNNMFSNYSQQNFIIKAGNFTGLLQKYIQLTLGTNLKIELESNYQTTHGLIRNPTTKELWLIQIKSPFNEIKHELSTTPYTINNDGGIYATRFSQTNGIIKTLKFPEINQENIDNDLIIQLATKEELYDFYENRIPIHFESGWSFDYINGLKATNTSIQINPSYVIKSSKIFDLEFSFSNNKPIFVNNTVSHNYTYTSSATLYDTGLKIKNTNNKTFKITGLSLNTELYFYSFYEIGNINKTVVSLKYKLLENFDLTNYYPNTTLVNSEYSFGMKRLEYFEYSIYRGSNVLKEYTYTRMVPKCLNSIHNFPSFLPASTVYSTITSKMLCNFNNDSMCFFPENDRTSIVFYNNFNISTIFFQWITTRINIDNNEAPNVIDYPSSNIDNNLNLNFLYDTGLFDDYNFLLTNNISNSYSNTFIFKGIEVSSPSTERTYDFNFNSKNYYSNKTSVYKNNKIDKYINECNLYQNRYENSYIMLYFPTQNGSTVIGNNYIHNSINCFLNYDIFTNKYVIELESPFNLRRFKNSSNKNSFLFTVFDNVLPNNTVGPVLNKLYENLLLTESDLSNFTGKKILSNLSAKDKLHYNLEDFYSLSKYNEISSNYVSYINNLSTISTNYISNYLSYTIVVYYYNSQSKSLSLIGKPFE